MKIKKYLSIYFHQFSCIGRIFFYPPVNKDFLKGEYDDYWNKRGDDKDRYHFSLSMKWWEKLLSMRYQKSNIVADCIEPNSVVLDIGCGDGMVLQFIQNKKPITGIGIDISEKAIEKFRGAGFKGLVADISDPAVLNNLPEADYILLLDIVEHVQYPERLMMGLANKFRKGIIVNVPNSGHYTTRLRMLFGKTPAQWLYFPGEHIRFWTVRDFFWWCNLLDLRIVRTFSAFGTWGLRHIMPGLFSVSQIYFIVRKQADGDGE
jgi:methionine biosynthesis protein MetW